MMVTADVLEDNVARIHERIAAAARRAGRSPDDIMLVAVTKTHPPETVRAAFEAGLRHFGENRVEEGTAKIRTLEEATWHMIGHIQSRKTADVVEAGFAWVHSVGRYKIARRLHDALSAPLDVLIQVNVSGEESKFGYANPHNSAEAYTALTADIERMAALEHIRIRGLMTMAPYDPNPEEARPFFRALRRLRDTLSQDLPGIAWTHLSMGMSGDFEVAIEEGATIVRLGTALFGPRV